MSNILLSGIEQTGVMEADEDARREERARTIREVCMVMCGRFVIRRGDYWRIYVVVCLRIEMWIGVSRLTG